MRSVSRSAWVISSMDSLRVHAASLSYPQFSCILACRKYWLIAVSSLVSCSLSSSITRASPCIAASWGSVVGGSGEPTGPVPPRRGRSADLRGHLEAVQRIGRAQPVADPVQAAAAAGAGVAGLADLLLCARAGRDDGVQRRHADGVADAGVHAGVLRGSR